MEDTIKATGGVPDQRTRLAITGLKDNTTRNLKMQIELAVGMKAMVVLNIATETDLTNGTGGIVQGFVLDLREECTTPDSEGHVHLQYPPPVIYFKPDLETNTTFQGLSDGIIPISPSMMRFSVDIDGEKVKLERRQLAIVPAYMFTDYKSQGQTMEHVIVDILKPPTGMLSPFSVYIALSRSRRRMMTIHILIDFDPVLFMHHPSEDLRIDMIRLENLDQQTKESFDERRSS